MPSIKNERGAVLVTTLIVMVLLLVLGTALASSSMTDLVQTVRQDHKTAAHYLARSGAEAVATYLLENPEEVKEFANFEGANGAGDEFQIDKGNCKVEVTENGKVVKIESTGVSGNYSDKVILTLNRGGGSPIDMAVFTFGSIELGEEGTGQTVIVEGDCATNSTIENSVTFSKNSYINGDLYTIGANENIALERGHLNGDIKALVEPRSYQLPAFPAFPNLSENPGDYTPRNGETINKNAQYKKLTITKTLNVDLSKGDIHIRAKELEVSTSGGKIILEGEGILYLYVESGLKFINQINVNTGGDPNQLIVYYKGAQKLDKNHIEKQINFCGCLFAETADIELENCGNITGSLLTGGKNVSLQNGFAALMIYAPNADVRMSNNAEINGPVVCNNFSATNTCKVTYIENQLPVELYPLPGVNPSDLTRGLWEK